MSIFRFSNAGGFGTYQRYNDFLAGNPTTPVLVDNGSMFPLGVFTLSGTQATVDFTNIPQTYTHLQIRAIARANRAGSEDSVRLRFNSDSGNNYSQHLLYGNGSSAISAAGVSQSFAYPAITTAASDLSNTFCAMVIDILDYKNTNKNTTIRSLGSYDINGAGISSLNSGVWLNTAAVTSISLSPGSSSWVQNSSFALYGVL